ncbi:nucleoporin Ndc1 [Drosophila innubila]|uniref:nucleoporin Ndc1 n=1 Tax=Drosophila innubila TaxID=198719 RepID=UPI00148E6957|nr:nucleoporin Ndc1 [Drosophila innubila]
MHQRTPICHSSWQVYVMQEVPLKLCLLTVHISLSYYSCGLYLSNLAKMDMNLDMSSTSRYLMLSSVFCGFYHFLAEHLCRNCEIWPLPVIRVKQIKFRMYWMKWPNIWQGLRKSAIPMLIVSLFYWHSWQVFYQSCCINTLITVKLHEIKSIYGAMMLRKLPLTLRNKTRYRQRQRKLPLILALSTTSLHGFQLQVAKDFYHDMANKRSRECRQLFKLDKFKLKHSNNWKRVRNVLLGRIKYFMRKLEQYLELTPVVRKPTHRLHSNMRPLMLSPPKTTRHFSCRSRDNQPFCQPWAANSESFLWLWFQRKLCSLNGLFNNYLMHIAKSWSSQNYLEYELNCGLSLIWLIQGLVRICIRSLKEDKYGILQADLERIFQLLIELERLLYSADKLQKYPSASLALLLPATSRSINRLIYHFKPYLNFIVKDENLLKELRSRQKIYHNKRSFYNVSSV